MYIDFFYLSLRLDKMRTLKKRDFFFFLSLSLNLSQDSDCLSACVCSSEEKKEEELVRRFSLCVCSSDLSARACVCVARVCFYGENLIKKNFVFWSPTEKRLPDLTKKIIIISITFKGKNEREEGAMKAKHDEREREESKERAQRMMKKKSSLCVFSSFCRPPTAL